MKKVIALSTVLGLSALGMACGGDAPMANNMANKANNAAANNTATTAPMNTAPTNAAPSNAAPANAAPANAAPATTTSNTDTKAAPATNAAKPSNTATNK